MSAREELLDVISYSEAANNGSTPEQMLDAYRAEILRERAEKAREFMGPETMPYESEANARFVLGWHAAVKYMAEESS